MSKVILVLLGAFMLNIPLASAQQWPESKQHYAKMYNLAVKYNDYGAARNALYHMLVEEPSNDSLLFAVSYMYFQEGKFASSVISAQDILAQKPNHLGALEISAVSYENLGMKDKSLANYETLYLQTNDYQTLYKMAFLQYDLNRLNECKTNIDILMGKPEGEKVTVTYTNDQKEAKEYSVKVSLLNLQGLVHLAKENKAEAKKSFEAALAMAPDLAFVKENLNKLNN